MPSTISRRIGRTVFYVISALAVVAAFLRGQFLFGTSYGIIFALVPAFLAGLLWQSRTPAGRVSVPQVIIVTALALSAVFVMIFPTTLNSDLKVIIEMQSTDRQARAELAAVFASHRAFRELTVSTEHFKVVNVTVEGSLKTRAEFVSLRAQIETACPSLKMCFLHWDILIGDGNLRIADDNREILDNNELFEHKPAASARGPIGHECQFSWPFQYVTSALGTLPDGSGW